MARLRDFLDGVGFVLRGFRFWATNPKLALLGALPPAVVGAVMLTLLVLLGLAVGDLVAWATPFADEWSTWAQRLLRVTAAALLLVGTGALLVLVFSGLTLAVGSVVYERISREVDDRLGMDAERVDLDFWPGVRRSVADGLKLAAFAIPLGLAVFAVGLIPLIGSVLGFVLGAVVGGRALALELTSTALDARGRTLDERRALLRDRRATSLGFGVACFLMFLIPMVAVFAMPAVTAGGTLLARSLSGERIS